MIAWWIGGRLGADGTLEWLSPQWVVLLAGALALLAWVSSWPGRRPWPGRLMEAGLWGAALALLVAAVARPVWVEEEGRREGGRLAVLVDASRSMSILEDGRPRHEQVDAILRAVGDTDVDLYHFGDSLGTGPPGAYDLPATDIEAALAALSDRVAGERLAGVVLVTDGLDRGFLRRRYATEAAPEPPAVPGPLTVFQVGRPGDVRDLAVRSVDAGGYGFLRSPFRISAVIEAVGYPRQTVPVKLERDGATVTEKRVTLDAEGRAEVAFDVLPEAVGRFTYTVSVPIYEDDAVPSNNSAPVVVRIVRDRIRVLQVAGAPSWDVKFMRRFLKGDPSVDLVSFFILRTGEDMDAGYHAHELSLIEFPYARLFELDRARDGELRSFDLVVFHNFDYGPYFQVSQRRRLLDSLRRYVEDEGYGFVMIGGDRSFDLADYGGTEIERMLPVELGMGRDAVDPAPFRPRLAEEGARHPITRLLQDPAENAAWWNRLRQVDGTNVVARAKPDATVLLEHPTRRGSDGAPLPVLAVREAGKGRSMALTLDTSWRWSLSEAAEGRGNQAYLRFWKNAIRWLVKDPATDRVTVETPRENYGVGDSVRIVVRARDAGFAPRAGALVTARVDVEGRVHELVGTTGADGDLVLDFEADERGAHRVEVEVHEGTELLGEAATVFAVSTRDPEIDEVNPDGAFLARLAASVGGTYYGPGERGPILRDPDAGRTAWDRRVTPLWRAPALLGAAGLLAGLAWIVRRRSGLR